jgi:hypothetical protein
LFADNLRKTAREFVYFGRIAMVNCAVTLIISYFSAPAGNRANALFTSELRLSAQEHWRTWSQTGVLP